MENNPCMEDRIAISRLKQGDLSALETLVRRYQVQAVHAAYAIVYDRALAEDMVQTAFVKVAERIHQFDEERPFAPWFLRVVVNDAVKAARKQKIIVSLDKDSDELAAQLAKWLIDPNLRPEQMLEQKEMRQNNELRRSKLRGIEIARVSRTSVIVAHAIACKLLPVLVVGHTV